MSRRLSIGTLAVLVLGHAGLANAALSFDDRVRAETALLRVYHAQQVGDGRSFEQAVPREALERRVRDYLARSVALETIWHAPLTAGQLDRELVRIAHQTGAPEQLRKLFVALEENPFLLRECLARRTLATRLTDSFFAQDPAIHAAARQRAAAVHRALIEGRSDPLPPDVTQGELLVLETGAQPPGDGRTKYVELDADEFTRAAGAPAHATGVEDVSEERTGFVVRRLIGREPGRLRFEVFRIPKRSWSSWWSEVAPVLDISRVEAGDEPAPLPEIAAGAPCEQDVWRNGELDNVPQAVSDHEALWTGSAMVVLAKDYVMMYDPALDEWSPMGRPTSCGRQHAIWTGSEVIYWGESCGGRYDPLTEEWTPVSSAGAPLDRAFNLVVWTGSEMLIWGGFQNGTGLVSTGARYNPTTDTWAPMTTVGAPSPRSDARAVWTGSRMIVWGGADANSTLLGTGARYDPKTDSWSPMTANGAPAARRYHTAVWSGTQMIVWGGWAPSATNTGGRYDPVADAWLPTATTGAPSPRRTHSAVWTGSEKIVWGGAFPITDTGGRYDPTADAWITLPQAGAPSPRLEHSAVWTGSQMIVWGGGEFAGGNGARLRTGGRYDTASDAWTPTSTGSVPLGPRTNMGAVWTGSEMILWGGSFQAGEPGGARYDPALGAWATLPTAGAPSSSSSPAPVWTGSEMIIVDGGGGRYDPLTDRWTTMSLAGAPPLGNHAVVWTDSELYVWGSTTAQVPSCSTSSSLARYDPVSDHWTAVPLTGAPTSRHDPSLVWTGSEVIVWGGTTWFYSANHCHDSQVGTGARYDPALGQWMPMHSSTQRAGHTTVWTGNEMMVWGGKTLANVIGTGEIYDPSLDAWQGIPLDGAPSPRKRPVAFWTGLELLLWGGDGEVTPMNVAGARFDPASWTWRPISVDGEPISRHRHTGVWTGSSMFVWGGLDPTGTVHNDGGGYVLEYDADGDGICSEDDLCPLDPLNDADTDGLCADADNCPAAANSTQTDRDADFQGDRCDLDDGVMFLVALDPSLFEWEPESGYDAWNAYTGDLAVLRASGDYTQTPGSNDLAQRHCGLTEPLLEFPELPLAGQAGFVLVTGVSGGQEGSLGMDSAGNVRPNAHPCP